MNENKKYCILELKSYHLRSNFTETVNDEVVLFILFMLKFLFESPDISNVLKQDMSGLYIYNRGIYKHLHIRRHSEMRNIKMSL